MRSDVDIFKARLVADNNLIVMNNNLILVTSILAWLDDQLRGLNLNLEVLVFVDGGKPENPETLGTGTKTNNKLNPHVTPGPGIEARPHWWEACALTTATSLLQKLKQKKLRPVHSVNSSYKNKFSYRALQDILFYAMLILITNHFWPLSLGVDGSGMYVRLDLKTV